MYPERILLDIETQRDFFDPDGRCYRPSAAKVATKIRRLFRWARKNKILVLSTVLRVRKGERSPLSILPHCIEGTEGEQKMTGTILPTRINLGLRNTTDLPRDIFSHYQQVIIEKRDTNIFSHARAERIITELPRCTFILCGAGVAHGIVQAAVGLRSRGFSVVLARDAVWDLYDPMAEMAYCRKEAKSVISAPTRCLITPQPTRKPIRFRKSVHVG